VKALVATSALGMGYDKPDLGFVVHYQSPGSPVFYYQQVGRAGRAVDSSVGVLWRGDDDEAIARLIEDAVAAKWAGHQINQVNFVRPTRSMSQIGG